jgi:hypothetical protein
MIVPSTNVLDVHQTLNRIGALRFFRECYKVPWKHGHPLPSEAIHNQCSKASVSMYGPLLPAVVKDYCKHLSIRVIEPSGPKTLFKIQHLWYEVVLR